MKLALAWGMPGLLLHGTLAVADMASTAATMGGSAVATAADSPSTLVIVGPRGAEALNALPISGDALSQEDLQQGQAQIHLSESLVRIPGITALNRQNYAQDLQISSRGFGARASFGIRGLRLYADGIPATMPDGQGQVSHFDLGSAARVEVLRGPFSALYGHSSGGVIALYSEDGEPGTQLTPTLSVGSAGTWRAAIKVSGDTGRMNYLVDAARLSTDGYREHSAARRDHLNAKWRWQTPEGTLVTLVANALDMPFAQDPLGLTRAEFTANPRQATPSALAYDTRKSISQQQAGLTLQQTLGEGEVQLMAYGGYRSTAQYQAILASAQVGNHPGGVIALGRDYQGLDLRYGGQGLLLGGAWSWTLGASIDLLREDRRGYANFDGTQLGVLGSLRRSEDNVVGNRDQYAQVLWQPAALWRLLAGLRHSVVSVSSRDKFITAGNPDDSGATAFSATTPALGVTYMPAQGIALYGSLGRGFETPTLNELAYQSGGSAGLNFALRPALSRSMETGLKSQWSEAWRTKLSLFRTETNNEIVAATNAGGRASYQNAAGSDRQGLEASMEAHWQRAWTLSLGTTALRARYAREFVACRATGCTPATSVLIPAGNRLPGVPARSLFAELAWKQEGGGLTAALALRHQSAIYVNDENTDAAAGHTLLNGRISLNQQWAGVQWSEFLRVDNLAGRRYIGSVIVNESNGRYFEPAPGRSWTFGLRGHLSF